MKQQVAKIQIDLESYRPKGATSWDLPPWGHPLSQGIMPLCASVADYLIPIGTAFVVSRRIALVVSAEHSIREALKYHVHGEQLRRRPQLPENITLDDMGLSVLHHRVIPNGCVEITVWPLEFVNGGQPTDVVFGSLQFQTTLPWLTIPLSFDVPRIGSQVRSIGYCGFHYPEGGIPLTSVQDGTFDWHSQYSHRLHVVEGQVQRIFLQRFASAYIEGPCFTIDAEIEHGQSGGPVLNTDGYVCGVNSAVVNKSSIISLLYPLLTINVSSGVSIGPARINVAQPLLELVCRGVVATDGSEEHVSVTTDEDDVLRIGPRIHNDDVIFTHDDINGYENGKQGTLETRPGLRIRKRNPGTDAG
jgi:hypothetical protein